MESAGKIHLFSVLASIFLFCLPSAAQPGFIDSSFGDFGKINTDFGRSEEMANDLAIQSDGKIVVAGGAGNGVGALDFAVVRYYRDGTLDTNFSLDGKVLTPIGTSGNDIANAVVVQPDGKIVVGGYRQDTSNIKSFVVVRYNPNGILDTTFNDTGIVIFSPGSNAIANDLLLQPDGKIVQIGKVTGGATDEDFCLVRYNSNGTLDESFGLGGVVIAPLNGKQSANSAALSATNRIIVGGYHVDSGGDSDFAIATFQPNGDFGTVRDWFVSTPIGNGTSDVAYGIAIQPDGKIVLVGTTLSGGKFDTAIIRYTAANQLDPNFSGDGKLVRAFVNSVTPNDVKIHPNGRIIVGGFVRNLSNNKTYFTLQMFNPDGSSALSGLGGFSIFNNDNCYANAAALQPDGKIVLAGSTDNSSGNGSDFALMRFQGDSRERADFDGDGHSDLSIFRPSDGQWWRQNSFDLEVSAVTFGLGTDRLVPGDFDGDGKTDNAFWRESTGEWFILRSSTASFYSVPFGASGDIPAQGDFDGDWKTDLAVFRPSNGTWFIQKTTGGTAILQWGASGDLPVTSDYDGDNKADVGIFRPSDGSWWINRSTAGTFVASFGTGEDKPVPGDYTGDGKTDIAVWRPSNGTWYVHRSENSSFYSVPFGSNGDIPVAGNFDGDNKFDLAVFRPSSATWYVNGSRGGTIIQQFGTNGDLPVLKGYIP